MCKHPGGKAGCETMFNRVGVKLDQRDMVSEAETDRPLYAGCG